MKKVIIFSAILILSSSCSKSSSCYDANLAEEFETIDCQVECTNFEGCDGQIYCNECTAATYGIRSK